MSHPGNLLQKAIYDALMAHAPLATAMGGTARVYDRVPQGPTFPYVTIGDEQLLDDSTTCDPDAFEVYFDIHVWTDAVGLPQGKVIAGAVRDAILAGLTLSGWTCPTPSYQTERHFRDADGMRGHGVLTFRAFLNKI